jgi:hypothetical protein
MLEKIKVLNKIEILPETGHILVRYSTRILEDGVQIGSDAYHRESYEPGATLPDSIAPLVSQVSDVVWTKDVIDAFKLTKLSP